MKTGALLNVPVLHSPGMHLGTRLLGPWSVLSHFESITGSDKFGSSYLHIQLRVVTVAGAFPPWPSGGSNVSDIDDSITCERQHGL